MCLIPCTSPNVLLYVNFYCMSGKHIEVRNELERINSPFTTWVLGIELRLLGLAAGAFSHWTISSLNCFVFWVSVKLESCCFTCVRERCSDTMNSHWWVNAHQVYHTIETTPHEIKETLAGACRSMIAAGGNQTQSLPALLFHLHKCANAVDKQSQRQQPENFFCQGLWAFFVCLFVNVYGCFGCMYIYMCTTWVQCSQRPERVSNLLESKL